MQNSSDIVAVFGNNVECCFDIVADVDGALRILTYYAVATRQRR